MALKLYPAMDLLAGECVRLAQGRFEDKTVYSKSPLEVAAAFEAAGATSLHIVDLQGAKDPQARQTALLQTLLGQVKCEVQVGGGVRTLADAESLLKLGAARVVIGSLAVQKPELTEQLIRELGADRITLALDLAISEAGEAQIAVHGWQTSSGVALDAVLPRYRELGINHLLCTDISRDGMLSGPNIDLYRSIVARYPGVELQASGGIRDLRDLHELNAAGIPAAILGRSIYQGTLKLEEAFRC
jgi:phosphoribosylformimino-5-aminoimidazole carboxamide ribotide isomerase